jgi:hypothetical protein
MTLSNLSFTSPYRGVPAMFNLPPTALAAATLWILACAAWFSIVLRRWFARRQRPAHGLFPGALINGIFLVGLTPIISAIQYVATGHRYFWGGAGVLFAGLTLIASQTLLKKRLTEPATAPDAMAFREKSIAAQMAAILLIYGFYGVRLWGKPLTPIGATAALISITILVILINVASHIAIRIYSKPEPPDERDQAIDLRGSRNGYAALAAGVWGVLFLAIGHVPYDQLFYAIMGVFALAELVRLGSQLLYYRWVA